MTVIQRVVLIFIIAITACGKPAQAERHTENPVAQSTTQETATRAKPGMDEADQIANLIDPGKLEKLKERGANSRVQKITAILATAKNAGKNPEKICKNAVEKIGWAETVKGELTAAALLRNLTIAEKLGATTPEDISAMRKGNSATVRSGPYDGDILSVDHIIPRSIAPELDNVICNLELMPLRLNQSKGDNIGERQRDFARKLYAAGLLADPRKFQ